MENRDGSAETPATNESKEEIQLTPQTQLAARIMYRELLRASHDRLKKTGQLKIVQVGPKRGEC